MQPTYVEGGGDSFCQLHFVLTSLISRVEQCQEGGEMWKNTEPCDQYWTVLRPNSWTKFRQKLFTVTSTALPWGEISISSNSRTLLQFLCTVQLLYTVREKGGNPDRKPYPLPYSLRNPYRNLKSENSQDYAQKPQQNFTFMNSASGKALSQRKWPPYGR
jgi:hypothetical protein